MGNMIKALKGIRKLEHRSREDWVVKTIVRSQEPREVRGKRTRPDRDSKGILADER